MNVKRILIAVSKPEELKANGIPLSPATLRKWHSTGKCKSIFIKLGGMLCIDLGKYHQLLEEIDEKNEARDRKISCIIKKFDA